MEDRGAQAAQAPYFTVTTVTTVTLGWQVFLPSKEYGIVMQSPLVVEGWQQIRILKKTCVGQTKNVCVLTRPVSRTASDTSRPPDLHHSPGRPGAGTILV